MMKNKVIFILFLAFLIAPALTFPFVKGQIDSGNHENRRFAEKPTLSLSSFPMFPQQFDDYFNDYLPYKNQLVMLNTMKNDFLGVGTTALEYMTGSMVIKGKDNWLFYNAEKQQSFNDYICNNLYEEAKMAEIAEGYVKLQKKLKEEYGAELVVIYATNKEQIYPEYMPDSILPVGTYSRTDQLVEYMNANTSVPVLYTKEALQKEKDGHQLFYKYDTHWNNLGGFVGTQVLNEYFHGEYVSLDELSCKAEGSVSGDLARMLSMGNVYNDDIEWNVKGYKKDIKVETSRDENNDYVFSSNAEDKRSLLVYTDSFGYAMLGMAKDYAHVRISRNTDDFKYYCETMKPDVVVLEMVERWKEGQETWCKGLYDLLDKP